MIRPHKIILVEDNPADAELTRISLEKIPIPHTLVHLSSGKDLYTYLEEEQHNNIALIILDLNMPNITGKELLKSLCVEKNFRKIPILIFSSSMQQEDIQECYAMGANAYVRKPIDVKEFSKAINAIAMFWLETNVLPIGIS